MSKEKVAKTKKVVDAATSDRLKKAMDVISKVQAKYGEDSMRLMSSKPVKQEALATGSIQLDVALGIGGLPKGRIIEIYGPEASGKTTLALHVAAECQKKGGIVAFIDAEHALDTTYAQKIGLKLDELALAQPDSGEQGLDMVETLIDTGEVDLIIVDSVAALTPTAELEGEMGDLQMGLHARMMAKGLRKLVAKASKSKTTIIFINQIRLKIGFVMGNPETTTGGNALKYAASTRLDIRRTKSKTGDATKVGIMKVKIVKHKLGVPFKEVEIPVVYGVGIDQIDETYVLAKELCGLIHAPGGKNSYKGEAVTLSDGTIFKDDEKNISNVMGGKRDDAIAFIKREPAFFDALRRQVVAKIEEMLNGDTEIAVGAVAEE